MKFYQIMDSPLGLIKSYVQKCHINDPRFLGKHNNRSKVDFEPILSDIIMEEGQKIPDYFSAGGMLSPREVVSTRLKTLLEKSCEKECLEFLPMTLFQSKKKVDGYWITNLVSFSDESLDFERSTFTVKIDTPIKNKYGVSVETSSSTEIRKFKNLTEFLKVKEEGWGEGVSIFPEKPFIKQLENRPILLFNEIPIVGIIVSEVLKKEMLQIGLEGIEFKPLEIPNEEWFGPNGLRKQFYS
jgi:hypothetical protein